MVTILKTCLDINGLLIRLQSRDHHLFIFVITNYETFSGAHAFSGRERERRWRYGREGVTEAERQKKFMSNAFQLLMQIRYFGF